MEYVSLNSNSLSIKSPSRHTHAIEPSDDGSPWQSWNLDGTPVLDRHSLLIPLSRH